MNDSPSVLTEGYAAALHLHLRSASELTLSRGYEIGRQALNDGLGVLYMAMIHSRALSDALNEARTDFDRRRVLNAAEGFFAEALSPFEMAQRGFRDANAVLRQLNDVLEGQAKRIAYTLHDEAGQLLASAHLALAALANNKAPELSKEIQNIRGLLNQVEERLRHISHELRPSILDDLGLVAALKFLAESADTRWGLHVGVVSPALNGSLPAIVETTIYRVAQEGLSNVARHAEATHVDITLHRTDRRVSCSIRDNGVGLRAASSESNQGRHGLGLVEIQERIAALGGVFRLGPANGRGTNLTIEIPLEL
jgi:signal transduction histidine kinase